MRHRQIASWRLSVRRTGTWAPLTICDKHADMLLFNGSFSNCQTCGQAMPITDNRPWTADDEMLLRLGRMMS